MQVRRRCPQVHGRGSPTKLTAAVGPVGSADGAHKSPWSTKLTVCAAPTMIWSSVRTSMSASASLSRPVILRSALQGSGSPLGGLCQDHGRRVVLERRLYDLARVDALASAMVLRTSSWKVMRRWRLSSHSAAKTSWSRPDIN